MKAKKITNKAMADACGVTPSAVSSWFRTNRIGKGTLAQVATVLDMDLHELMTGDPAAKAQPTNEPTGPSPEAAHLGVWLDRITDAERRGRIAHQCMALILREIDGPHLQPTETPGQASKKPRAARQGR